MNFEYLAIALLSTVMFFVGYLTATGRAAWRIISKTNKGGRACAGVNYCIHFHTDNDPNG